MKTIQHRTGRVVKRTDQVIPTSTTWVMGDLSMEPWVNRPATRS